MKRDSVFNNCYKFRIYPNNEQEDILNKVLNECRNVYNKLLKGLKIQSYIFKDGYYLDDKKTIFWEKYYTGSGFDLKKKPKKEDGLYKQVYDIFNRFFPDCVKSKINRGDNQKIVTYYTNVLYPSSKEFYFSVLQYENWKIFRQLKTLRELRKKGIKIGGLI